jgi:hypothetical protein
VIPRLIDVLVTPNEDEEVVSSARMGLHLLSRKIEGYGPPSPSTPEQRQASAQKWREWFEAIRPLDLDDHDDGASAQAAGSASASAPSRSPSK